MSFVRALPVVLSSLLLSAAAVAASDTKATATVSDTTVVYLVRHAEKAEEEGSDPGLAPAGRLRAKALAEILTPLGIDRVLSTDYRRTRDTAAPIAESLGLEVAIYDPARLEELAAELRARAGERVLVVGHSNTTPALVELLGGDPGDSMGEAVYDRLYRVELPSGRTTLKRFEAVVIPVE